MATTDFFGSLPHVPPDAIFALAGLAKKAPEPKADLIIGAYRDAEGRPYVLQVVRKAERRLLDMNVDKEYLPMRGLPAFLDESVKLVYGDTLPANRIAASQGLSGTGSLTLGAMLLSKTFDVNTPVYISSPTWPNHYAVMQAAGFKNTREYRYYKADTRSLDFEGLVEDLTKAPERSIILLHACAHNPTGVDPTHEQWAKVAEVMKARHHVPFFDSAYQGYATGNLDNDAFAVRLFVKEGMELILAQSFAKNLGLYSERAGVVSVVTSKPETVALVNAQLEGIVRSLYSSPPAHGARVAHLVLSDPELRKEWEAELRGMAERIKKMRQAVYDGLKKRGTPGTWEHVISQVGMFSYLGLTKAQCEQLREKRVFVLSTGRANMASLTDATVELLVNGIDEVVRAGTQKL